MARRCEVRHGESSALSHPTTLPEWQSTRIQTCACCAKATGGRWPCFQHFTNAQPLHAGLLPPTMLFAVLSIWLHFLQPFIYLRSELESSLCTVFPVAMSKLQCKIQWEDCPLPHATPLLLSNHYFQDGEITYQGRILNSSLGVAFTVLAGNWNRNNGLGSKWNSAVAALTYKGVRTPQTAG